MNISTIARSVRDIAVKNSPAILTTLGILGFGTTVVLVAKASPEATEMHQVKKIERETFRDSSDMSEEEIKKARTDSYIHEAKVMGRLYGPPAVVGIMSIVCFLGANKIRIERHAALAAAYSLSTETLSRYQEKVIEKLGESEHADILKEATRDLVRDRTPDDYDHDTEVVPMGMVRCYDNVTGRYFWSTRERILEAESEINKRLLNETRVCLQEFYYALGVEERFNLGEILGWDVSSYYAKDNSLDIVFAPMLDDDKNPCLAINYHAQIFERDI